jgi:hypothetical protein
MRCFSIITQADVQATYFGTARAYLGFGLGNEHLTVVGHVYSRILFLLKSGGVATDTRRRRRLLVLPLEILPGSSLPFLPCNVRQVSIS